MASTISELPAEVRVRRHSDVPDCDVIVVFRGREISLRCRNYKQAVEWARIECKSYKIAGGFTVEILIRRRALSNALGLAAAKSEHDRT